MKSSQKKSPGAPNQGQAVSCYPKPAAFDDFKLKARAPASSQFVVVAVILIRSDRLICLDDVPTMMLYAPCVVVHTCCAELKIPRG
jgi:hypothetical protein